jgi:hypothetical protein
MTIVAERSHRTAAPHFYVLPVVSEIPQPTYGNTSGRDDGRPSSGSAPELPKHEHNLAELVQGLGFEAVGATQHSFFDQLPLY